MTFTEPQRAEIAAVVRATMDQTMRRSRRLETRPAIVHSYYERAGSRKAVVLIDGDPPDHGIEARVIVPVALVPEDRVMVTFDPPEGIFVSGLTSITDEAPPPPSTGSGST